MAKILGQYSTEIETIRESDCIVIKATNGLEKQGYLGVESAKELIKELSDWVNDSTSENSLHKHIVNAAVCKGDYLLKNKCRKYGGMCSRSHCDYWQTDY